jgi:hypothetical protein
MDNSTLAVAIIILAIVSVCIPAYGAIVVSVVAIVGAFALAVTFPIIGVPVLFIAIFWRWIATALRWFFEGLFIAEGVKWSGLFRRQSRRQPKSRRRARSPYGPRGRRLTRDNYQPFDDDMGFE